MPAGQRLLDSLAETLDFFFSDVLPTMQAVFYPVQVSGPRGCGTRGHSDSAAWGWAHPLPLLPVMGCLRLGTSLDLLEPVSHPQSGNKNSSLLRAL